MPDTETLATETQTTDKDATVAKAGKVERVEFNLINGQPEVVVPATEVAQPEAVVEPDKEAVVKEEPKPEFTEEQKQRFLRETFGDDVDVETIKNKLKPEAPELTEEQKQKQAADKEMRLMKIFVDKFGGTPEQYNLQKQIANVDPTEFSKAQAIEEAKVAGFNDEEAKAIANERFYQIQLDSLEQDYDNDESDEDFEKRKATIQKKIDFGNKQLAAKSQTKIQQAKDFLTTLQKEADSEDLQRQEEERISSKVDEVLKTMPREVTLELGKSNDEDLAPIVHKVSEESVEKVRSMLGDPAQRNNLFLNEDGTLDIHTAAVVLLKAEEYNRLAKNALLEGQTRQAKIYESVFPARSPYALGIGGVTDKQIGEGKATTRGKREVVRPQYN